MIYYKGLKKLQAFLKKGEMKNVDIMDELQSVVVIPPLTKSISSSNQEMVENSIKNVVGNQGYWRLKEIIKQK